MADARFETYQPNQPVRVCIAQEQFRAALREAKITREDVAVSGEHPYSYPGFVGPVSALAAFVLVARERFGPYDSEMLARIVQSLPHPDSPLWFRFYFPGLELY